MPDTLSAYREEIKTSFGKDLRYVRPTNEEFNIFGGFQLSNSANASEDRYVALGIFTDKFRNRVIEASKKAARSTVSQDIQSSGQLQHAGNEKRKGLTLADQPLI